MCKGEARESLKKLHYKLFLIVREGKGVGNAYGRWLKTFYNSAYKKEGMKKKTQSVIKTINHFL